MLVCLICKWLCKLEKEDGIWQSMIKNKYFRNQPIHQCNPKASITFLAWVIKSKRSTCFYHFCRKLVGNGMRTCFGEDGWLGDSAFQFRYSRLYNLFYYILKAIWGIPRGGSTLIHITWIIFIVGSRIYGNMTVRSFSSHVSRIQIQIRSGTYSRITLMNQVMTVSRTPLDDFKEQEDEKTKTHKINTVL